MAEPRRSAPPGSVAPETLPSERDAVAPLRPVQGRRPPPGPAEVHAEDMPSADPFLAGSSPLPPAVDRTVPDDERVVRLQNQARQGKPIGRMRWVLGIGLALVVVAFAMVWLIG